MRPILICVTPKAFLTTTLLKKQRTDASWRSFYKLPLVPLLPTCPPCWNSSTLSFSFSLAFVSVLHMKPKHQNGEAFKSIPSNGGAISPDFHGSPSQENPSNDVKLEEKIPWESKNEVRQTYICFLSQRGLSGKHINTHTHTHSSPHMCLYLLYVNMCLMCIYMSVESIVYVVMGIES